jgi:hypothetical protein
MLSLLPSMDKCAANKLINVRGGADQNPILLDSYYIYARKRTKDTDNHHGR